MLQWPRRHLQFEQTRRQESSTRITGRMQASAKKNIEKHETGPVLAEGMSVFLFQSTIPVIPSHCISTAELVSFYVPSAKTITR